MDTSNVRTFKTTRVSNVKARKLDHTGDAPGALAALADAENDFDLGAALAELMGEGQRTCIHEIVRRVLQ